MPQYYYSGVPPGIEPWPLMLEARVKTASSAELLKLVSFPKAPPRSPGLNPGGLRKSAGLNYRGTQDRVRTQFQTVCK